jgi:hypothetical protein
MKTLRSAALLVLMGLSATKAFSQSESKINFFKSLPEKTPVAATNLSHVLNLKQGEETTFLLSGNLAFKGRVISNIKKYENLQSVLLESVSSDKTVFQISRQLNKDKTITYVGRMMNRSSGDGLMLTSDEGGNYYFTKFETSNILQDCSYAH